MIFICSLIFFFLYQIPLPNSSFYFWNLSPPLIYYDNLSLPLIYYDNLSLPLIYYDNLSLPLIYYDNLSPPLIYYDNLSLPLIDFFLSVRHCIAIVCIAMALIQLPGSVSSLTSSLKFKFLLEKSMLHWCVLWGALVRVIEPENVFVRSRSVFVRNNLFFTNQPKTRFFEQMLLFKYE